MLPVNMFACTQSGSELHPDEGQIFLSCPHCASTIYLDKSRVVFHWVLGLTLDEEKARASLARWMAGNDTVKNLDKKAQLQGSASTCCGALRRSDVLLGGRAQSGRV